MHRGVVDQTCHVRWRTAAVLGSRGQGRRPLRSTVIAALTVAALDVVITDHD